MKYLYNTTRLVCYVDAQLPKYGLRLLTVCFHSDVPPILRYFWSPLTVASSILLSATQPRWLAGGTKGQFPVLNFSTFVIVCKYL